MGFTSLVFIAFLMIVVLIYFQFKKNQWIILLIASLIFYLTWGVEKLPFIFLSSFVAWTAGRIIGQKYEENDRLIADLRNGNEEYVTDGDYKQKISKAKKKSRSYARTITIIAVIVLCMLLIYAKVGELFLEFMSLDSKVNIIVPLGISYYIFSLIGYVLDCYWRKEEYEKNFFKLLLFAIYFPKIIQGPILKCRNLIGQLTDVHEYKYKNLCYGVQLMLWGYVKKLVIADRLAIFVDTVYADYIHKSGSVLLVASVLGAIRLYCDFSGCMDIACGFSEIIDIKLERNFNHPFFSESASEFWRRWHITLGVWFRDYIYMPVSTAPRMMKLIGRIKKRSGMSVAKNIGTIIALYVVWFLTGLWHGIKVSFIVWGIYWGSIIAASVLLLPVYKRIAGKLKINTDSHEWHLFRKIRTFFVFVISMIIMIPENIKVSLSIFKRIIIKFYPWELVDGTLFDMGLNRPNFIVAIVFTIVLYLVSRYEERYGMVRDYIASRQIIARWLILYALLFSIVIFGIYGPGYDPSSFIYMNF